jgi:hypothetical protein
MTNSQILAADSRHLNSTDRQRQFLLKVALLERPCPVCFCGNTQVQARGVDLDVFPVGNAYGGPFKCRGCSCPLEVVVPVIGPVYQWAKARPAPALDVPPFAVGADVRIRRGNPGEFYRFRVVNCIRGERGWQVFGDRNYGPVAASTVEEVARG